VVADGAYTNKAPGGVAYRCSFRVTEASYLIERLVQNAAYELGVDPAELRRKNFIQPEQFPYKSASGFEYDSGDYETAMNLALDKIGYSDLRAEQAKKRADGKLWGVGMASFIEVVGAGPHKEYDIIGIKMNDGAELRIHPTGTAGRSPAARSLTSSARMATAISCAGTFPRSRPSPRDTKRSTPCAA
jgi:aerobic carbon-monoxide dehydrogenase large subunit